MTACATLRCVQDRQSTGWRVLHPARLVEDVEVGGEIGQEALRAGFWAKDRGVATILLQEIGGLWGVKNEGEIIDLWYQEVQSDPGFQEIPMSRKERIDHLPGLLKDLVARLEKGNIGADPGSARSAAIHGRKRREQGYSATQIVQENRLFYRVIANRLQQNLLDLDISTVIPDLIRISEMQGGGLHTWLIFRNPFIAIAYVIFGCAQAGTLTSVR